MPLRVPFGHQLVQVLAPGIHEAGKHPATGIGEIGLWRLGHQTTLAEWSPVCIAVPIRRATLAKAD